MARLETLICSGPRIRESNMGYVILFSIFLGGCSSLSSLMSTETPKVNYSGRFVQHTGVNGDVMSHVSRSQWVQLKKSSSSEVDKLYANLGAHAFDVAVSDARNYLVKHPKSLEGLTVLATGLAMTGKYQLASYYAGLIDQYHPGQAIAMNIKALSVLRQPNIQISDYRKAISYFREGMSRSGFEVASALNLGHVYLSMGNSKNALEVFRTARDRCKACAVSLLGEGTALVRQKQYRRAKVAFNQVLKKDKQNLEAHYRLALVALNGENDPSSAKRHLEVVLAHPKDDRLDLKRRANVLLRRIEAKEYAHDTDDE